eukprot:jgi/Antlo1/1207/1123
MQSLKNNLVELSIFLNEDLSDKDWKTVGEMTKLERLYIGVCDIQAETIAKHMQSLKNNITVLSVTWNRNLSDEDWKTVGGMTKLEWLNISDCDIQAGKISEHMQSLKNNITVLNVSENRNLSDDDWKTVGEMRKLEWLYISDCDIQAGTITKHMQSLKNNLVMLYVSWNKTLCDEDWKTVGEMRKLEWLDISGCDAQAGTITKHMQSLKSNLVVLDVSSNRNLSDKDWKTVGEMTNLKKLNISGCDVQEEQFLIHLGGLRCHIEK